MLNVAGWNNTTVAVTLDALDHSGWAGVKEIDYSFSGAESGGGAIGGNHGVVSIFPEGNTTLTYFATDNTENQETPKTLPLRIDRTPPAASAAANPRSNANDWNNTSVTVTFSGTDALSGIDACTPPRLLSAEGSGQSASGTCTDKAGNVSTLAMASVNIDITPPVISGMPTAGCTFWPPNQKLVSVATVTASDALSGIAPGSFKVIGTSNESAADSKSPDIVITPNSTGGYVVQLRADRLGNGNGRIYTLNATANDLAGNTATVTTTCTVPHDQGKK